MRCRAACSLSWSLGALRGWGGVLRFEFPDAPGSAIFSGLLTMNTDDLSRLLSGANLSPIQVGVIHEVRLCQAIHATTHAVLLSKETVVKQKKEHSDLTLEHYRLIPDAIRHGLVIHERARPDCLTICYNRREGERYVVALKGASSGAIFVTSFHKMRPRQIRSFLKRGDKLRLHH